MINVAQIDHWAANGSGAFHRASIVSKLLFLVAVVSAAVLAVNPYALMTGYGILLATAAANKLPWAKVAVLSWYGALFAVLYAISLGGGFREALLFIMKAITPAFAVLMIIVSTPYPKIFSTLDMFLPEVLATGLSMTYRSLFILLDMMGNFAAAIRLRGGFSPGSLYKNNANISRGIGMLLVRAVERASRLYAVMVVRGYNGKMVDREDIVFRKGDWLPFCIGMLLLVTVLAWN